MAEKKPKAKQKVTCKAFIRINGELTDVDTLNREQKDYLGAKIQETMLNTMYCGKAQFTADVPPVEDVFPQVKEGE